MQSRSVTPIGTAHIGWYVTIRPQTDTRTIRYRAVLLIEAIFALLPPKNGRKKKREKKRENLEIRHYFPDPDPCPWASRRFARRIFDDREKKKTFLLPARASRGDDISSPRAGRRNVFSHGEKERGDRIKRVREVYHRPRFVYLFSQEAREEKNEPIAAC
ncbi:hypothetical protein BHE74_00035367 [Ensete ventricosum]|nr:hypothetical protein BHE74_00035367 [Ensete ventricosum]